MRRKVLVLLFILLVALPGGVSVNAQEELSHEYFVNQDQAIKDYWSILDYVYDSEMDSYLGLYGGSYVNS